MQPYPRAPDLVSPGHLHGTGCLSAGAMDTGFPTVVWCLCLGLGFSVTPPLLAGVFGCVLGYGFWFRPTIPGWGFGCVRFGLGFGLRPATPGWGVGVCVCLCARPACTPPLLAGVCGVGVCAWARVPAAPRYSWLGCWDVCVCLWAPSACTPPLLAGVYGVGVCGWALVLAAPRHSWLGCWGVCVFVCVLRLYPATPGWGVRCGCVCLGSCFACAPPLLAGVLGCVCVCVRAPLVPRHSWLGCAAWVSVLGLVLRLRPATSGWGVGVCVCLCARSACTLPPLPWVCGVSVGVQAGVSAAPRHSWLGCWGVFVFVGALRLHPATPGPDVRCGCVCLGSGFGCVPPLLAGVLGCVCVCVRAPLVTRHSWLGCAVWVCLFGLEFRLRPATPGWGGGVCVCWCAWSPCTPPLLVGGCGVGVCAWARVSAAPRHSWLGCWGVCVFVCALHLYPATPGWGVRCGCACLGSGFGCAPPLLARVVGCVCAGVRAPLVPRHSWLGCAVWLCALGLAFRLRPATPGWGVGVCVWSCAHPACTPPLKAGVCGVGVCACARVSAAPRHSWLGCSGVRVCVCAPLVPRHSWLGCAAWVCVLGLGFRLRPATPGLVVCVCECWCAHSPCTPPLLAGVCGVGVCVWARVPAAPRHVWLACSGVLVCVRAPLVPRHSWLGRGAWMCVFGFGFRLRPATPGWGVGVCVCWCGRSACTPPLLAGVCGVGVGVQGVGVQAGASAAPLHSWLGCWGVRVCVRAPPVPRDSWLGCAAWVCVFGFGFRLAPQLLVGVLGCLCAGVGALLLPRHSGLGCALWVCVFGLGFRLRPATPGWGVGVCVCWCGRSLCTPPLLAGVCGVGVCVWAGVLAAPRHAWLGCCGVRVCVRALLVPRHSWLGRGAWVCVLGFGFWLRPATPGWGVGVCVCLCACSACTLPLLAGVCGLGVCVSAWVSAAPRHSWLGCWGVRVGVCALLVPRHSLLGCAALVCVLGLGFRLRPATPGWGGGVCVCWRSRSACTPPLLAGVCGVGVCVRARVSAAPRHSWLGCWGVCVLVRVLLLYPATPGWVLWVCVLRLGFWLRAATPGFLH